MKLKFLAAPDKQYRKVFVSLTIAIFVTIVILSAILYFNFEKIATTLISDSMKDSLSQVSYSATYMRDTAKALGLQVYFDSDVTKLLYSSPDVTETIKAYRRLNSYHSISPFIHSIYIYNGKNNRFYTDLSLNESTSSGDFYDREVVDIIENFHNYQPLLPIPRVLQLPTTLSTGKLTENIYSLLIYDTPQSSSKLDEAVILNISENWLRETIDSVDVNLNKDVFIIDKKGVMVISNQQNPMITDISGNAYVKRILDSKNPSGYFITSINGIKTLVTYVSSNTLDWIFISNIPYADVTMKIDSMKYTTMLIAVFILIAGLLLSVFLSRNIYKSIFKLLQKLKLLEAEKRDNILVLKQEFLRNILTDEAVYDIAQLRKKAEELELTLDISGYYTVAIIKIDRYSDFCNTYNVQDRSKIKHLACNYASSLSAPFYSTECLDMGHEHLVLILNTASFDPEINKEKLSLFSTTYLATVKEELDISVSIIFSRTEQEFHSLSGLYDNCRSASLYTIFSSYECTLYADKLDELASRDKDYEYPMEKSKRLTDAFMMAKTEECSKLYLEIIEDCKGYSYDVFYSTLTQLSFSLITCLYKIAKNNEVSLSYDAITFSNKISKLEKIEEINAHFLDLFTNVSTEIDKRKATRHNVLIDKIHEFVNMNYFDQNLSIDSIIDKCNIDMSPIYLGRLYKKLTSKSIGEYINETRIEKANELLGKTGLSIDDITTNVGFSNSVYFYSLYKKMFGITPSQYRQKASSITKEHE